MCRVSSGETGIGPIVNCQWSLTAKRTTPHCQLSIVQEGVTHEGIHENEPSSCLCMAGRVRSAAAAASVIATSSIRAGWNAYGMGAAGRAITCFTPQVQNGRILDQTLWNYNFEPGTDKLNPSGLDKLDQIVRRRPSPTVGSSCRRLGT